MRNEAKWTKRPWEVTYKAGDFDESVGVSMASHQRNPNHYKTAHLWHSDCEPDCSETVANAHLIAAAPELHEALERLKIEVVLSDVDPAYIEQHFRPHLDKAEAALAKADDRLIKPAPGRRGGEMGRASQSPRRTIMSAATMNEMERLRREWDEAMAKMVALANRVDFLNQQNSSQQEQNDELAALCAEAADVLDKTANDTLLGRNMADKLRRQAEGGE